MSSLTGRLALREVIERGWKQLQGGFLKQLRQTSNAESRATRGMKKTPKSESFPEAIPSRAMRGTKAGPAIEWDHSPIINQQANPSER